MGKDEEAPPKVGVFERAVDRASSLIGSLPPVWRAIVLIILIVAGGLTAYKYFGHSSSDVPKPLTSNTVNPNQSVTNVINLGAVSPPSNSAAPSLPGAPSSIAISNKPLQYVGGNPDPEHPGAQPNNPQNLEAAHKAAEDNAAVQWHFSNLRIDNPPEVKVVPDTDSDNYLHYKYFANTDKCLFINRRENGTDHAQWVRDPTYHKHDIDWHTSVEYSTPSITDAQSQFHEPISLRLFDKLTPSVLASTNSVGDQIPTEKEQASGPQFCVNPHPGNFRYWWGTPIDQCNSPMYRQFGDGCTHYQIYNRCANAWDVRIFWTYCRQPPHG